MYHDGWEKLCVLVTCLVTLQDSSGVLRKLSSINFTYKCKTLEFIEILGFGFSNRFQFFVQKSYKSNRTMILAHNPLILYLQFWIAYRVIREYPLLQVWDLIFNIKSFWMFQEMDVTKRCSDILRKRVVYSWLKVAGWTGQSLLPWWRSTISLKSKLSYALDHWRSWSSQ